MAKRKDIRKLMAERDRFKKAEEKADKPLSLKERMDEADRKRKDKFKIITLPTNNKRKKYI